MASARNSVKSSKPASKHSSVDYKPGDVVLAVVKGYVAWPAVVVEDSQLSKQARLERESLSGRSKVFSVQFFQSRDFGFIAKPELSTLDKEEIQEYIENPKKKNANLMTAYKEALDPKKFLHDMKDYVAKADKEFEEAVSDEDEEEDDEDDNEDDEDETSDKLEEDAEEDNKKKKNKPEHNSDEGRNESSTKSRSKSSAKKRPATDMTSTQANKKSKTVTLKLASTSNDKTKSTNSNGEEKSASTPSKLSVKAKEDDEKNVDPIEASDFEEAFKLRYYFQKAFLGNTPIDENDMPSVSEELKKVESRKDFSSKALIESKFIKVMRRIAAMNDKIPRNGEFEFTKRAQQLVEKWGNVKDSTSGKM